MNKLKFVKFLNLYHLSGCVDAVKLISDGVGLKTSFVTADRTLAGTISYLELPIESGEYGIYDTTQFKKLLTVLADEVEISVNKCESMPVSFCISDKNTESVCILADLSVIPSAPKVKEIKNFDVEIPITGEFVDRFIDAKRALPCAETFTIISNKKSNKFELVIGYSTINTNRIKLNINPIVGKDVLNEPISFNANYFKEILDENRDIDAVFKVSSAGIAQLYFKSDDYEATYYLIKKEIE